MIGISVAEEEKKEKKEKNQRIRSMRYLIGILWPSIPFLGLCFTGARFCTTIEKDKNTANPQVYTTCKKSMKTSIDTQ